MDTALKHFLVEEESSNVGVITDIANTPQHKQYFAERLIQALAEHFDTDDISISEFEFAELFSYRGVLFSAGVDGNDYEIKISETWIY